MDKCKSAPHQGHDFLKAYAFPRAFQNGRGRRVFKSDSDPSRRRVDGVAPKSAGGSAWNAEGIRRKGLETDKPSGVISGSAGEECFGPQKVLNMSGEQHQSCDDSALNFETKSPCGLGERPVTEALLSQLDASPSQLCWSTTQDDHNGPAPRDDELEKPAEPRKGPHFAKAHKNGPLEVLDEVRGDQYSGQSGQRETKVQSDHLLLQDVVGPKDQGNQLASSKHEHRLASRRPCGKENGDDSDVCVVQNLRGSLRAPMRQRSGRTDPFRLRKEPRARRLPAVVTIDEDDSDVCVAESFPSQDKKRKRPYEARSVPPILRSQELISEVLVGPDAGCGLPTHSKTSPSECLPLVGAWDPVTTPRPLARRSPPSLDEVVEPRDRELAPNASARWFLPKTSSPEEVMKTLSVLASSGSKLAYSAFVDGMRTSCPDASPWASSPSVVSSEAPLATTPSVQSVVELTPPVLSRSVLAPSALVNDVPTHSCCSKALGGGRGRGRGRGAIPSLQSTPATKPKMSGPSLSVGKEHVAAVSEVLALDTVAKPRVQLNAQGTSTAESARQSADSSDDDRPLVAIPALVKSAPPNKVVKPAPPSPSETVPWFPDSPAVVFLNSPGSRASSEGSMEDVPVESPPCADTASFNWWLWGEEFSDDKTSQTSPPAATEFVWSQACFENLLRPWARRVELPRDLVAAAGADIPHVARVSASSGRLIKSVFCSRWG